LNGNNRGYGGTGFGEKQGWRCFEFSEKLKDILRKVLLDSFMSGLFIPHEELLFAIGMGA